MYAQPLTYHLIHYILLIHWRSSSLYRVWSMPMPMPMGGVLLLGNWGSPPMLYLISPNSQEQKVQVSPNRHIVTDLTNSHPESLLNAGLINLPFPYLRHQERIGRAGCFNLKDGCVSSQDQAGWEDCCSISWYWSSTEFNPLKKHSGTTGYKKFMMPGRGQDGFHHCSRTWNPSCFVADTWQLLLLPLWSQVPVATQL